MNGNLQVGSTLSPHEHIIRLTAAELLLEQMIWKGEALDSCSLLLTHPLLNSARKHTPYILLADRCMRFVHCDSQMRLPNAV